MLTPILWSPSPSSGDLIQHILHMETVSLFSFSYFNNKILILCSYKHFFFAVQHKHFVSLNGNN